MIRVPLRAAVAILPAGLLYLIILVAGGILLQPYHHNAAYPAYIESLAIDPGDVGADPIESTPKARSVADMETMDTFYAIGREFPSNAYTLDNRVYYIMILESGERVLARINFDHAEKLDGRRYRLPVGRWVPLELSDDGARILSYNSTAMDRDDYYMDMLGDFGKLYSEDDYFEHSPAYKALDLAGILTMMVVWFCIWRFFAKKNWF